MLDLYSRLVDHPGNVVLSEISLHRALTMLHKGTRGRAHQQMAKVLVELPTSTGCELTEANGLWVQAGLGLVGEFDMLMRAEFGASTVETDFDARPEAARREINSWIAKATRANIRELLQPGAIQPSTRLVLANAIFFKGAWRVPFDPGATRVGEFVLTDNSTVSVPFMTKLDRIAVAADSGMTLLELPYEGNCRMRILVPIRWADLDLTRLPTLVDQLKPCETILRLPRFEARFRFNAEGLLAEMGMADAFSPDADLSGIVEDPSVGVSSVVHETHLLVDEEGSEASAATAVGMVLGSPGSSINVNRPFLFWIECNDTTLFRGRMMDPSS